MEYKEIGLEALGKIIELWNKNIGVIYPMDEGLIKQNLKADSNWRKILGAYYEGELVGFVIMKQWTVASGEISPKNTTGYINFFIVDMNYRHQGIGSKLLKLAEEELKGCGVKKLSIGGDPFHFFPGVPMEFKISEGFLSKRGYEMSNSYNDMICDISKVELDKLQGLRLNSQDTHTVEILKDCDKEELFSFFERCFSGRWYGELQSFFDMGMENRDIVVIKDSSKIMGFCHIYDSKSIAIGPPIYWRGLLGENYGGLGPIGVDAEYRGKGLGLTLLYRSLEVLKSRGIRNMIIDWTDLVEFYGIFNFVPWKQYKRTLKEL